MTNHTYRIGDEVHARGRGWADAEHVGIVIRVEENGDTNVEFHDGWQDGHDGGLNDGATNRWCFSNDELRPVTLAEPKPCSSPIRTITRREVVPGNYGPVSVGSQAGDAVWVVVDGSRNATELREAAHLFNQIAEVLEEQAVRKEAA